MKTRKPIWILFFLFMTLFWSGCGYLFAMNGESYGWVFLYGILTAFNFDSFMKEITG